MIFSVFFILFAFLVLLLHIALVCIAITSKNVRQTIITNVIYNAWCHCIESDFTVDWFKKGTYHVGNTLNYHDKHEEIDKMEEKNDTLTRAINFKISKKEDAFLDSAVNTLYKDTGFKISKSCLIRRYCTRAHFSTQNPTVFNMQFVIGIPIVSRTYNVNHLMNLKRENLRKKKNGEVLDDDEKVIINIRLKLSEEDLQRINSSKQYVEELSGVKVSMSDFIRFCINSEEWYLEMMKKEREYVEKAINLPDQSV